MSLRRLLCRTIQAWIIGTSTRKQVSFRSMLSQQAGSGGVGESWRRLGVRRFLSSVLTKQVGDGGPLRHEPIRLFPQ